MAAGQWNGRPGAGGSGDRCLSRCFARGFGPHQEVVCIDGQSGVLKWRLAVGGPVEAPPLVAGSQIIVATRAGKILALDAQSGAAKLTAPLPQPVRVAPVADAAGKRLYVATDYLYLFVLDAADLKCVGSAYLGHEPGSVQTSPIWLAGRLIVAENHGASSGLLHVLTLDENGLPAAAVQRVETAGHVLTAPVVIGDRLVVLNDRGRMQVFAFGQEAGSPLRKLDETQTKSAESLTRYGLAHAGKLWTADAGLRRYDFQPATGKLAEGWQGLGADVATGPPQAVGDNLYCVRRDGGGAGAIVTAVRAASGVAVWETRLAAPLAAAPLIDPAGSSASVVSTAGAALQLDLAAWQGSIVREYPAAAAGKPLPRIRSAHSLGAGQWRWFLQARSANCLSWPPARIRPGPSRCRVPSPACRWRWLAA